MAGRHGQESELGEDGASNASIPSDARHIGL